jgi:Amidohydrolase
MRTSRDLPHSVEWQDMDRRVKFLDREGFAAQVIYPTVGLLWEAAVKDPALADALCRAYNTWALEICYSHKDRLIPAAHISLRDPGLAVRELTRVAKLGCHAVFVGAAPCDGRSLGDPIYDPIWAAAQDLDLAVGLHLVGHAHYPGSEYFRDRDPGFMWVSMNVIQDPRIALAMMATNWAVSPLTAEIATAWIEGGAADAAVQWRRREAQARCDLAAKVLGRKIAREIAYLAFHFWMRLPEPWRADEFVRQAKTRGVILSPPELFAVGRASAPHAIRICLGATRDRDSLRQGLSVLADLLGATPPLPSAAL